MEQDKKLKKNKLLKILLMKVYLKVHTANESECIACCDEDLMDRVFKEGDLRIEITKQFFGGKLIGLEDAIPFLKGASNFNIIGEKIINKAIECNILHRKGIRFINSIPIALRMMF